MPCFITNIKRKKGNFKNSHELKKKNLDTQIEEVYGHESEEVGDESYEVAFREKWNPCVDSKNKELDEKVNKNFCEKKYEESHYNDSSTYSMEMENVETNFLWSVINEVNNVKLNYAVPKGRNDKHIEQGLQKMPPIKLSKKYIDVGCLGIWKLSSSRNKSDMKKLKDENMNTYWQSSSLGPHTITIQFFKLTKITKIYLLFNYSLDESYTPYEILTKVGNDENHLDILCSNFCDVNKYTFNEPFWFIIDLEKFQFHSYFYNYNVKNFKHTNFVHCRCLQICIMSNQHYGRDTRIRQVKIFGPNYSFYKYDKSLIM
ncbi:hypothetical protein, conserved [Plasmodium gonderi]|uniref:DOC domain-containing protein n=1 Tax=Plasmodium gonderi TaxID=77519 RepID=A0A1Y1JQM4_PLAGO|nr:hypothetical protein, conserved [Plasmodium gonderi]GAW83557.1 hypothetical protein, conserved [Plasmodium gonderi]